LAKKGKKAQEDAEIQGDGGEAQEDVEIQDDGGEANQVRFSGVKNSEEKKESGLAL
jgi:hypothetical protein